MLAITSNGMSSSLNPSIDRARQAERIAEAEVHVFRADQHADICHELVDGHQAAVGRHRTVAGWLFSGHWTVIGQPLDCR